MGRNSRSIRRTRRRRSRRTAERISSLPRSECVMTHRCLPVLIALLLVGAAAPARAANKEHQQLMADIRMLQEQAQQRQNILGALNESIKAVNGRLDDQ